MVARSTQVDPRGWPQPEHVTSPAPATTVIGPTWPPTLSHYINCLCMIDSIVPQSTSITCLGDYCLPFRNKVLKHIMCWILSPTGRWEASVLIIKKLSSYQAQQPRQRSSYLTPTLKDELHKAGQLNNEPDTRPSHNVA